DIVRKLLHLPNVHIFTMGVVMAVLCLIVAKLFVHSEEQLVSPDEPPEEQAADKKVVHKNPLQIWREMIREPTLWRLVVLIGLIVGVRAVYVYGYLLMPKYWLRTIGPDAAFGTLNAINPIGIVFGLVLFIPFANRFGVFRMLVYGAMISSVALLPMALPWTVYGMSIGRAHYLMALLCMVLVTIGEVVWSPKLYEYTPPSRPRARKAPTSACRSSRGSSRRRWSAPCPGTCSSAGRPRRSWSTGSRSRCSRRWSPTSSTTGTGRRPCGLCSGPTRSRAASSPPSWRSG